MSYEFLFEALDNYCERLGPGFWAEPINAFSNIFMCAVGFYFLFKKSNNHWVNIFSAFSIGVGIGSFLFHTTAQKWSMLADLIPIYIFMVVYVYYIFKFLFKITFKFAILAAILFIVFNIYFEKIIPREFLNGSALYLPSLVFLALCYIETKKQKLKIAKHYLYAALVFLCSLAARSLDLALCEIWPIGTHFIWHSLNGVLFYFLIRAVGEAGEFKDSATK